MSDSVKKYYELLEEGIIPTPTIHQKRFTTIIEILRTSITNGNMELLLERAANISKKGPYITPTTVFQIAGQEVKVDELCGKEKQRQWNNQE